MRRGQEEKAFERKKVAWRKVVGPARKRERAVGWVDWMDPLLSGANGWYIE